jgi:tRNA A-37 threonylcarbamoyl transferase component Bud32
MKTWRCIGLLVAVRLLFSAVDASSDLVKAYYQIYWYQASQQLTSDGEGDAMQLNQDVPEEITAQLLRFGLTFDSLPGLLQRALIWDGGYALGDNGTLAEIYTRCDSNSSGATTEDLALDAKQIMNAGCDVHQCPANSTNSVSWGFSSSCGPTQINDIVQCACSSVTSRANEAPLWATGELLTPFTNISRTPETLVRRHTWSDSGAGRSAILFAIHTSKELLDEQYSGVCASQTAPSSLTIPCIKYQASDDRWCRPRGSALMTTWLSEYAVVLLQSLDASSSTSSSFSSAGQNLSLDNNGKALADTNATRLQPDAITPGSWKHTIPVLIVGAAALIVTGVAVFIYLRRRSDQRKKELQNSAANQLSLSSSTSSNRRARPVRKPRTNPLIDRADAFGHPHTMHDFLAMLSASPSAWESSPLSLSLALTAESLASGSPKQDESGVLKALADDPHLKRAQVPFDLLQFHHLIARGPRSEVWLCVLRDRCVAIKRLHKEHRKNLREIRGFVKTVRLCAALHHPSILSFVGIAWSSLQNLCLVTEYLELGDLQEYLRQSNPTRGHSETVEDFMCFSLSWKREKLQLLLDITRGVDYLHQHRVRHGDLKARNVLLSSELDAKLTGFGSRHHRNLDVSSGSQQNVNVESPFWTAPEVLAGGKPSKKADIYSLGVVIAELDTHRSPYAHAVTARGERMPPLQVLQHVMSGHLKPSLLSSCPGEIVGLAEWCLHRDPSCRPSAREVVQAVRSIPGVNLDEFSL